jgi:hypothetical protein
MAAASINSEMLLVVIAALPILLTIVLLDRYLVRRRGLAANADYVARIQSLETIQSHRAGRLRLGKPAERWSTPWRSNLGAGHRVVCTWFLQPASNDK